MGTSRQGLMVAFMLVFELAACESSETNGKSVTSAEPSGAQTSDAEHSNELPGARLFASPNVLHFAFTLPAENWTQLSEHGDEEAYVQASVGLDDPAFVASGAVGLRHKGNWTLHHCWDDFGGQRSYEDICAKLSFKVKFDEYLPEQRVDGLKRLNLHALQVDQTKMHELVAYELFREFGVEAPRTRPATVSVNGQDLGLFLAVEEVDGRFTKAHFPASGDGNLYKEIWPNAATSEQAFADALETNEDLGDVADMLEFSRAVDLATPETLDQVLASHVDIEQMLRYMVVDRAIKNWDGVIAFYEPSRPHNFYWYRDVGAVDSDTHTDRFVLVPWDLDNTLERDVFVQPPESGIVPVPDWNEAPANCDPRPTVNYVTVTPPRCDKLLNVVALGGWSRFDTLGREFLQQVFTVERLQAKAEQWVTLLEPLVASDPTIDATQWRTTVDEWRTVTLPGLVPSFTAYLAEGLQVEEPPEVVEVTPPATIVTSDAGFSTASLNGFEFSATAASGAPDGLTTWADEASRVTVTVNTNTPIAGSSDLSIEFATGVSSEQPFVGVGYYGDEADVSAHQYLVLTMRAEPERLVRVALSSLTYDEDFGGVWAEFSVQVNVPQTAKQFVIPFADLAYPSWAKDVWTEGQGWTVPDAEAKALVLERVNGVAVNPAINLSGEDSGRLFVDDIYFD